MIRTLALLFVGLSLVLSGCKKDESPKQVNALRTEYAALLERGVHPADPQFAKLAEKLEAIPKDAKAYPRAQELLQSIRRAQGRTPARPLAREGATDTPSQKEFARCAELAKELGRAEGDARVEIARKLAECRDRAERLQIEENKADHPPHPH